MLRGKEIEIFDPTPYVYPKGYFHAQSEFAVKIVQLGLAPNIKSALLNYTLCYRNLVGKNPTKLGPDRKWIEFVKQVDREGLMPSELTEQTWQFYIKQSHSLYNPDNLLRYKNRFGSFIFKDEVDRTTNKQSIDIHFLNFRRGQQKSDFSREYTPERIEDLRSMFSFIQNRSIADANYRPQIVALTSWMNHLPGIQSSLPPLFVATSTRMIDKDVDFRSNALWGQFLDNNGGVNQGRYSLFIQNLNTLATSRELVNCFPVSVTKFISPIEVFFDYYLSR